MANATLDMEDSPHDRALDGGSQESVQRLLAFPPEIWSQITSFLSFYNLRLLKLVGSKTLWRNLRAPRAVRSVNVTIRQRVFKTWSLFLDEFNWLTSLSIMHEYKFENMIPDIALDRMPKTLRKLEIEITGLRWADIAPKDDSHTTLGECLPNLERLDVNLDWETNGPWLSEMPLNLTFLGCKGLKQHPLPPTLLHLDVGGIDGFDFDFPRHLESLISEYSIPPTALSKLPQYLKHLEIVHGELGPDMIEQLPRTLTCLILGSTSLNAFDRPLSFPPLLVTLEVLNMTTLLWKYLPRGLKSLKTAKLVTPNSGTSGLLSIGTLPMEDLPVSLVTLVVIYDYRFIDYDDSDHSSAPPQHACRCYPPLLECLRAERWLFTSASLKQLPETLTSLYLYRIDEPICRLLPRALKTLIVEAAVPSDSLVQDFQHLPPALTSFTATFMEPDGFFVDGKTRQPIMIDGLRKQSWRMRDLPDQLTSLTWNTTSIGPEFLTHQKLNHLTALNLMDCFIEWEDDAISDLPRGLSSLQMGASENISGKCFKRLPRDLTDLNMAHVSKVRDEDIKHLPRRITHLNLTAANELTNRCLKDLPPGLLILKIEGNQRITADGLTDLPDPLRGPCGEFLHKLGKKSFIPGASQQQWKNKKLCALGHLYKQLRNQTQ